MEGILCRVSEQLRQEQPYRKETCPEVYEQVEAFCQHIDKLSTGEELPFTFIVDDPSGNSFVENPYLPKVAMNDGLNGRKTRAAACSDTTEAANSTSLWFRGGLRE